MNRLGLIVVTLASLMLAQTVLSGEKDKFAGSTLDLRTNLAFKVSDSAVQKMLPEGWQVDSPTTGPSKGYNLAVVLVDQILAQDPEGKPVDAARGAALVVPAKRQGMEKSVIMIVGGLFSPASYVPGPYGNYVLAKAEIERRIHEAPAGQSTVEELWLFKTDSGDSLQFQTQYTTDVPTRTSGEAQVYSAAKPDFYRIYRFDQAADVVRSTATGKNRAQTVLFKASGPQLTPLFDSSEQLISITAIPWYSRQIFLPGS
jgi:hypothetical protein